MSIIKFTNCKSRFKDEQVVSVKRYGNYVYVSSSVHRSHVPKIRLLGDGQYLRCSDGSVHNLKENKYKIPNMASCQRLYGIIMGNCKIEKSVFTTLTIDSSLYDEPEMKHKQAIRSIRKNLDPNMNYISVVEYQKRGVPHFHDIYIFSDSVSEKFETIQNIIDESWIYGHTLTKKIFDIEGLANYLTKTYHNKESLQLFPKGKKQYVTSRGIKDCDQFYTDGKNANSIIASTSQVFDRFVSVRNEETGFYDDIHQYAGMISDDTLDELKKERGDKDEQKF